MRNILKLPPEYYDEIEAYIKNGFKGPANYAEVLGIGVSKFLKMVDLYMQIGKEPVELVATTRKTRLTPVQKEQIYEAITAGGGTTEVASRFSVTGATIRRVYQEIKDSKVNAFIEPPFQDTSRVPETALAKLLESDEVGVFVEDEHIVIRIPKNKITRELLKGVL